MSRTINTVLYGVKTHIFLEGEIDMDNVKRLLDEELKSRIKRLEDLAPGSEEETAAVKNIAVLYDARNADDKKDQKVDRVLKYVFEGVTFVGGLLAYNHWFKVGLQFEKDGTFTTKTVQSLIKLFKPFGKR